MDEVIKIIKTNEAVNKFFWCFSRYHYLIREHKGCSVLKIKDLQKFIKRLPTLNFVNIEFEINTRDNLPLKEAISSYDPSSQFILHIYVDDKKSESHENITIFDSMYKPKTYYGKIGEPPEGVSNEEYEKYVMDKLTSCVVSPCIICGIVNHKIDVTNNEIVKEKCACCNEENKADIVLECAQCFTRYIYF